MKRSVACAILLLASSCGGGGGSGSGSDAPGTPAPPPASPLSESIQVYSAAGLGTNLIPHRDRDGELTGCTLVDLPTGQSDEITPLECQNLAQGPQTIECQVLIDGQEFASIAPAACRLVIQDGRALSGVDETATRAASNAQTTVNYYSSHFKRDGLDDLGSDVTSLVHVGLSLANAFYDRDNAVMLYGDGDGKTLKDTTLALDAAGHEMTHAVIDSTARLVAVDEPGAVGEATSDYFGELVEARFSWKIAEDITIGAPGLRDLANPASLKGSYCLASGDRVPVPYPAHMRDEYVPVPGQPCNSCNDACYVHLNSTIISHALYLLHQGVGQEKAEHMYYLALTQYFGPMTDFQGAADETIAACAQLYDQETCDRAADAFAEVGLEPTELALREQIPASGRAEARSTAQPAAGEQAPTQG